MKQSGYTLIEVLVATVVVSILLVALLGFLTNRVAHNAHQNARDDMLRDTQVALDVMMDDIRHASHADDENRWPDDHAPGGQYSWGSTQDTLVLARPATDSSNDYIYEDSYAYLAYKDNIIYFTEEGTLYKRILAADTGTDGDNSAETTCPEGTTDCPPDLELANNVTDFQIRYIDADGNETQPTSARAVEAYLQVSDTVYQRDVTVDYTTRAVFRN